MKSHVFFLYFAALLCGAKGQTIDLTPRFTTTMNDGIVKERPYFGDGAAKYAISLDRDTQLSAAEGGALFRFRTLIGAQFEIKYSSAKPETAFEGNLPFYRTAALTYAAPGAKDVQLEAEIKNPLTLNGWRSYRFVLAYTINGQSVRDSITFLNLDPKQQIVLRTSASQKDFPDADKRSARIMNSWYEMLPGDSVQGGS